MKKLIAGAALVCAFALAPSAQVDPGQTETPPVVATPTPNPGQTETPPSSDGSSAYLTIPLLILDLFI